MSAAPPIVVVGGGPAGLSVATGYREAGGAAPVVMLCDEPAPPYRRPPLTKGFLRGITGADELPLRPASWYARQGIDVRLGTAAVALDAAARTVVTDTGEEIVYGGCALCTGSEPRRADVPGAGLPGVHVIRTARDSAALGTAARRGSRVVVVGAGFVGCEAAASLAARGAAVCVVTPDEAPQARRLGPAVAGRLGAWLREAGVEILSGRSLVAVEEAWGSLRVVLDEGEVACDLVLMAVGARPRTALAESAGLALERGAVPVDASMRTAADGVVCAGDPALAANRAAGRRLRVEHWGDALRQGEIAGRTLAGADDTWGDVPGFWSTVGQRTLKQAAWGDGWDVVEIDADARGFTAWYGREGSIAGVLTHERDLDYDAGARMVRRAAAWPFSARAAPRREGPRADAR